MAPANELESRGWLGLSEHKDGCVSTTEGIGQSSEVITNHIEKHSEDYRFETEKHPVEAFPDRTMDHRLLSLSKRARA